jgi:hypothetical protein
MTEPEKDEPEVVNVNDIVRQRLEADARSSVESLVQKETTQGVTRDKDDLSRPITLGEARKLVGEINGSFDKVKQWVEGINGMIGQQNQYIQSLEARVRAQDVKVNDLLAMLERNKPLPLPPPLR